jgi:hypothetical protein
MDRQTLRDWVILSMSTDGTVSSTFRRRAFRPNLMPHTGRFSPGSWKKARFMPSMAWCGGGPGDLIMRLHEEFGISVSDDTIYRALKELGFSHVSARPKAYKQDPEAMEAFKKLSRTRGGGPREARARHTGRSVVPGRNARRAEKQAHLPLGSEGLTSPRRARSAHPVDLPVRCSLPDRGAGAALVHRSTTSSITAATPGTHLSANLRRSCPSPDANGRPSVTHCEDWYYVSEYRLAEATAGPKPRW